MLRGCRRTPERAKQAPKCGKRYFLHMSGKKRRMGQYRSHKGMKKPKVEARSKDEPKGNFRKPHKSRGIVTYHTPADRRSGFVLRIEKQAEKKPHRQRQRSPFIP